MTKTIFKPLLALLILTTFITKVIGQEVDMNCYISFNVISQAGIEIKAEAPDTPIKIVKENGSSEEIVVGPDWMTIYFNEPSEKIIIYGNLSGFKTYMFPFSGIEDIYANSTELKELYCTSSHLTSLDVSNLTNLKRLDCSYNELTDLNVANLTNLEILNCYSNRLSNIDISDLTALKKLACNDNLLTSLDVSNSTNLTELNCHNNHLDLVILKNLTNLMYIDCGKNKLTSINVNNLINLKKLLCFTNQLTSLDVGNLINLEELSCYDNQLNAINQSNNLANLTILECGYNKLTTLDISNSTNLEYLYCQDNQLSELNVSNCPNLTALYCSNNQLTTLDVRNLTNLNSLSCYENNFTTQALDDIYCTLPDSEGKIRPAYSPFDDNIDNVLATNAQNARDKNWSVRYYLDNSDIPTTGSHECTTDINAIESESSVKVYPNPVSDLLYIESENIINDIRVYDISGKEVINKSVDFSSNTSIDVSNLIGGTYILKVYTDNGVGKYSFIKK